mmetsp:Transcript_28025/g.72061  ORF Transcript_28025/g.72061 Transcript_28025/m.72061 type:complete len:169 (-) Transcript_28025:738-1244(-)
MLLAKILNSSRPCLPSRQAVESLLALAVQGKTFQEARHFSSAAPLSRHGHAGKTASQLSAGKAGLLEALDADLLPRVALVGRPNVGKSALFNRLVRKRTALVYNTPLSHVTRDWQEQTGQLGDLVFRVMDTSGMEPNMQRDSIQVFTGPSSMAQEQCLRGLGPMSFPS